jgi:exosortase
MPEAQLTKTPSRSTRLWLPLVLLILVYLPTLYDLVIDWISDPNYSHGVLIPLVSIYLVWSKREDLTRLPASTSPIGIAIVIAGLVLFLLGTAAAEYSTARLSFVIVLFGLIWYLYGTRIARETWFAFFFLCFMIPIPYVIYYAVAFPLQITASKITVFILNTLGMGVVRQGNIIHLADGYTLEVAEACSGMRSLVSLLALGTLYAYLTQKRLGARLTLFVSTIPIAVFANVVRVLLTTLIAATITQEVTSEPIHTLMGLSVFFVAGICLVIVGALVRRIFR